jgi:cell division protein ZapA
VKQVEVQIMGHGYVLGCPEDGESRLNQAVAKVDEAMCKIRDAGKIKARDRIAVLAALNLAFDLTDRPVTSATEAPSQSASQLQSLLQRMDAVLGIDNQLL